MAKASHRGSQHATKSDPPAPMHAGCLGRTCLKWQANGELTDQDLQLVLERLAVVDRDVTALLETATVHVSAA